MYLVCCIVNYNLNLLVRLGGNCDIDFGQVIDIDITSKQGINAATSYREGHPSRKAELTIFCRPLTANQCDLIPDGVQYIDVTIAIHVAEK